MKKIFALLISLGALTTVFAQTGRSENNRKDSRDIVLGQSNNRNIYSNNDHRDDVYSVNSKATQIQRINREFDYKIMALKRDRHLRSAEKNRQIRILENDRKQQIRQVNQSWSNQSHTYNGQRDRNDNRRY